MASSPSSSDAPTLERTLGLTDVLTIGMGTMIGAGIFVFPGLAVGEAGPAAMASFLIGAVVAMLVALPTSELATAMPESGGGYYFVSRGLGALVGTIVGLGLWLGLIFASAFYLVGFGYYMRDLLEQVGVAGTAMPWLMGIVAGVLLTVVNVVGTERAGQLQNVFVIALLVLLTGILGYGIVDTFAPFGPASPPRDLLPFGVLPVLTTASLVFTSYLGFAQIANVAGEVEEPDRNLPLGMLASVGVVALFYVATIFVASSVFSPKQLEGYGESAVSEVAGALLGPVGVYAVLLAGLLATLSSANASILSSSRSVFALSRDRILPGAASRVSPRFGTPHVSVIITGGLAVGLTSLGQVELLAEVASVLHLMLYGMLCITGMVLRHRAPDWYEPSFRAPGYPWLHGLGAVSCAGLLAFMKPMSLAVGAAVAFATAGWYTLRARDVVLKGRRAVPRPPAAPFPSVAILVPLSVEPDRIIDIRDWEPVLERMEGWAVHLLGVIRTVEQATPEQAREQFGEQAERRLREAEEAIASLADRISSEVFFVTADADILGHVAEEGHEALLLPALAPDTEGIRVELQDPRDEAAAARLLGRLDEIVSAGEPEGKIDAPILWLLSGIGDEQSARDLHEKLRPISEEIAES